MVDYNDIEEILKISESLTPNNGIHSVLVVENPNSQKSTKIPTGVEKLDDYLNGGIPSGVISIFSKTKTSEIDFASQMMFNSLDQGLLSAYMISGKNHPSQELIPELSLNSSIENEIQKRKLNLDIPVLIASFYNNNLCCYDLSTKYGKSINIVKNKLKELVDVGVKILYIKDIDELIGLAMKDKSEETSKEEVINELCQVLEELVKDYNMSVVIDIPREANNSIDETLSGYQPFINKVELIIEYDESNDFISGGVKKGVIRISKDGNVKNINTLYNTHTNKLLEESSSPKNYKWENLVEEILNK